MPKRSNGFDKDPKRASLAGKKSSRAISPELKELRTYKQAQLEETIYKYVDMDGEQLQKAAKDLTKPAIDLLVISCMIKAIKTGDFSRIEPMLARSMGKVADKLDVDAKVGVYKLHDAIMERLRNKKDE